MMLKKISVSTINGLLMPLNCNTKIKKINNNEVSNAMPKNAPVSASCSPCPVCLIVTSAGILDIDLNFSICFANSTFAGPAKEGSVTLL